MFTPVILKISAKSVALSYHNVPLAGKAIWLSYIFSEQEKY
jgi:hypothetical protein